MGACEVRGMAVAESVEKAWREIVANAVDEYGRDSYNGTFSTCSFVRVTKRLEGKVTKANLVAARKMADKLIDNVGKRCAYAIDCGIDHYSLLTIKKTKAKGRPKQKFVVIYYDDNGREREKGSYGSMKDAESAAMKLAMDGSEAGIQKRYVYEGAQNAVVYYPAERVLKSCPKRVPKGARLVEYHKYYFYGIAAE